MYSKTSTVVVLVPWINKHSETSESHTYFNRIRRAILSDVASVDIFFASMNIEVNWGLHWSKNFFRGFTTVKNSVIDKNATEEYWRSWYDIVQLTYFFTTFKNQMFEIHTNLFTIIINRYWIFVDDVSFHLHVYLPQNEKLSGYPLLPTKKKYFIIEFIYKRYLNRVCFLVFVS